MKKEEKRYSKCEVWKYFVCGSHYWVIFGKSNFFSDAKDINLPCSWLRWSWSKSMTNNGGAPTGIYFFWCMNAVRQVGIPFSAHSLTCFQESTPELPWFLGVLHYVFQYSGFQKSLNTNCVCRKVIKASISDNRFLLAGAGRKWEIGSYWNQFQASSWPQDGFIDTLIKNRNRILSGHDPSSQTSAFQKVRKTSNADTLCLRIYNLEHNLRNPCGGQLDFCVVRIVMPVIKWSFLLYKFNATRVWSFINHWSR